MSTAPIPPDYDDESTPERLHPPRRRTKTIVRIAAIIFIAFTGLLAGFVVLLHNHSFRQSVLRIALPTVGRALGTDGRVRANPERLAESGRLGSATRQGGSTVVELDFARRGRPPRRAAGTPDICARWGSPVDRSITKNELI